MEVHEAKQDIISAQGRPNYSPQLETMKENIDYFKQNYLCSKNTMKLGQETTQLDKYQQQKLQTNNLLLIFKQVSKNQREKF